MIHNPVTCITKPFKLDSNTFYFSTSKVKNTNNQPNIRIDIASPARKVKAELV